MKISYLKFKSSVIVLSISIVFCSGCVVQSINPFFTEEDIVEYPELEGKWILIKETGRDVTNKEIRPWNIEKGEIQAYDENGVKSEVKITFFNVKDSIFLDSYPESPDETIGLYWAMHVFPVHHICKVQINKDKLVLIPLNYEWIEEEYQKGNLNLQYILYEDEKGILFTASSEDWIKFLKKHKDDPNVFSTKYEFVLKRQK